MSKGNLSVLVLGGYDVGKTHYGGQLLGRLNDSPGLLAMDGVAKNIESFEEVGRSLAKGRSAGHTPVGVYKESRWPLRHQKLNLRGEVLWPDYGGEQIVQIVRRREVSEEWGKRLRDSSGWLFFVRLQSLTHREDALTRPATSSAMDSTARQNANASGEHRWSPEAELIELLQILLHVRSGASFTSSASPALAVALSCWDEIAGTKALKPSQILAAKLPQLSAYLRTNWAPDALKIFGLSSLGQALSSDTSDQDFANEGPETRGYVVTPEGDKDRDLTLPLAWLMERHQWTDA